MADMIIESRAKRVKNWSYISLVHVEPFFVSVVEEASFLFVLIRNVDFSSEFLERK